MDYNDYDFAKADKWIPTGEWDARTGKSKSGCNCKTCIPWRKGLIAAWNERRARMAIMKSPHATKDWMVAMKEAFWQSCHTCQVSGERKQPMFMTRDLHGLLVRVWVGPNRKGTLTGYVVTRDAGVTDTVQTYVRSEEAYLRCLCGHTRHYWPAKLPVVGGTPERMPKSAVLRYWWAWRALKDHMGAIPLATAPRYLEQTVATFYVLQSLRSEPTLLAMASKMLAAQRVLDEIEATYVGFVAAAAPDMLAYLHYATVSELGHIHMGASEWSDTTHTNCIRGAARCTACKWLLDYRTGTYSGVTKAASAWKGEQDEYFAYATHVFDRVRWDRGFGGEKWGAIAKAAFDFARGDNTPAQFLDRSFNLSHNNGLCFDKNGKLFLPGSANVLRMLDLKRSAVGIDELGPFLRHFPQDYRPLAERALALLTLHGGRYGAS